MIAALVNAGVALGEPAWIEMAARAFLFIDATMAHGDRLGHSWREGKLLVPGLASDHAAMIRAALALYEATGEHAYLERALAWQGDARPPLRQSGQRRLFPHRRRRRGPGGAARAPPPTTRRRTRTRSRRRTWSGSRCSPASTPGATRPTGCSTASRRSAGEQSVRSPRAAQRARSAPARRRDRRGGAGRARRRAPRRRPQASLPRPDRAARIARAAGRRIRRRPRSKRRGEPQPSSASASTCSLPVTRPEAIAEAVAADPAMTAAAITRIPS